MTEEIDGWGLIKLLVDTPLEEINNPRKIFLKAVEEGKEFLAHFCVNNGHAVCGKGWLPHSRFLEGNMDEYWQKRYIKIEKIAVICPECKDIYEEKYEKIIDAETSGSEDETETKIKD